MTDSAGAVEQVTAREAELGFCGTLSDGKCIAREFADDNLVMVAPDMTVGANRIVPTIAIPHPLGNPSLTPEEEYALRKKLVIRALEALTTEIEDQTIFEV